MKRFKTYFRLIGLIGFAVAILYQIVSQSDSGKKKRSIKLEKQFVQLEKNFIVDTIYDNPNDHMNTTIYHLKGKWTISPFVKNLSDIKSKIKCNDSLVKIKGDNFLILYKPNKDIEKIYFNF